MANITRTLADTSGFIPQAWAQRALDVLRANIVLAKRVVRDTDYEPGWQGKTLNIPYPGTFAVQSKSENTAISPAAPTGGATVSVTLSNFKSVDFIVEDVANAQSTSQLMDRYVQPAAIALAEKLETDLFAQYANLTGTSTGTAGTDITAAVIRSSRKNLNDAKVPMTDRTLVLSDKDEIAVLGDTTLATYFAYSQNQAIAEGAIGRLYGFDVFTSQLVPAVAGTPVSTQCLAIHKDAILLATRPFRDLPPGSGVQSSVIVDQESGLSIRVLYQYDMNNRGVRVAFDILYGIVALRPGNGLVVLT
jgi:hypothetical protein